MTLYKGSTPVAGLAKNTIVTGFNIFDVKWSDHIINDIQWLRADTFSWQDGNVYTTAYNTIEEEYSTGVEETEDGITFRRSANGFKIADADMESAILNRYTITGIAWYYLRDGVNKRFKLPRTKFGFEGVRTNVADDIDESLPNITGSWGNDAVRGGNLSTNATGAFSIPTKTTGRYVNTATGSSTDQHLMYFDFNASRSSSTYQDNAPVQERATQMYLYFYVGEYTREAIEQTAGITTEQLNNKLDNSIIHITQTFVDGTSGYRIWSDGYCEQWGVANMAYYSTAITFTKPFKNTDINIQFSPICPTNMSSTRYQREVTINSYNANGFQYTSYDGNAFWKACGYLADGEY